MRLAEFIESNLEAILLEWEDLACQTAGPGVKASSKALIDHGEQMLRVIVRTMATSQDARCDTKGREVTSDLSFAVAHGAIRGSV